jgi:hypothetical protein
MTHIWDAFMLHDELDVLECRLYELQDVPNLTHVIVEANVTHQDRPKPSYFLDHADRFAPWKDRIVHVWATGLPTFEENPDPWAREHAQREHIARGLKGAAAGDVIIQSDVDEIPKSIVVRNLRPRGAVALEQRCFSMAVDWQHPEPWRGPVATTVANVRTFTAMRDARNFAPHLPNAGWHLGWLGGQDAQLRKLNAFCHPEIAPKTLKGIGANTFLADGFHFDGAKLIPVDVDDTWPRWIVEGRCPPTWFRPR